ncbi:hypothetical protein BAW75_05480 [Micromonospora chalcea]|nr:hypothetical protein BAW75_05480 [Micromonospora chalcea]
MSNKAYGVKPMYTWGRVLIAASTYGDATACITMHWLDPMLEDLILDANLPASVARESLGGLHTGNVDEFLKHRVVEAGELGVTVQQLVKHYANREGGVHYDPTPPDLPLLVALRGEHDLALRLTVLAIGRIVHRALEPLAACIVLSRNPHPYGLSGDPLLE